MDWWCCSLPGCGAVSLPSLGGGSSSVFIPRFSSVTSLVPSKFEKKKRSYNPRTCKDICGWEAHCVILVRISWLLLFSHSDINILCFGNKQVHLEGRDHRIIKLSGFCRSQKSVDQIILFLSYNGTWCKKIFQRFEKIESRNGQQGQDSQIEFCCWEKIFIEWTWIYMVSAGWLIPPASQTDYLFTGLQMYFLKNISLHWMFLKFTQWALKYKSLLSLKVLPTLCWNHGGQLLRGILLCFFLSSDFHSGQRVALGAVTALSWTLSARLQSGRLVFGEASARRAVWADDSGHTQGHRHGERLWYIYGPALVPGRWLQREEAARERGPGGAVVWVQHPPALRGGGLVAAQILAFVHLKLLRQCFQRGHRIARRPLLACAGAPPARRPARLDPFELPVFLVFAQVEEWVGSQRSGFHVRGENATDWAASNPVIVCVVTKEWKAISQWLKER